MKLPVLLISEMLGVVATVLILAISPILKNKRPLVFLYPRRELPAAVSIYIFVLLAVILGSSLADGALARTASFLPYPGLFNAVLPENKPSYNLWVQAAVSLVLLVPVAISLVARKQPLLSIGLNRNNYKAGLQLGFALALLTVFLSGKITAIISGGESGAFPALVAVFLAVIAEEVVFRGYIQPRLASRFSETHGWLITALAYLVWCIAPLLVVSNTEPAFLAGYLLYHAAVGLLYGWLMKKSGSLLVPILYHTAHLWILFL